MACALPLPLPLPTHHHHHIYLATITIHGTDFTRKWNNKIKWHRLKATQNSIDFSYIVHVIRSTSSLSIHLALASTHTRRDAETQTQCADTCTHRPSHSRCHSIPFIWQLWWLSINLIRYTYSSVLHTALSLPHLDFSLWFLYLFCSHSLCISRVFSVFRRIFSVVSFKLEHISRMKFRHKRPWYYWRWNMGVRDN